MCIRDRSMSTGLRVPSCATCAKYRFIGGHTTDVAKLYVDRIDCFIDVRQFRTVVKSGVLILKSDFISQLFVPVSSAIDSTIAQS